MYLCPYRTNKLTNSPAPEHYYSKKATERPRTCVALVGRPAWKAFKYATLIQAVIWAVRKAGACCATGRRGGEGTKKVGGTFYRKVADEERGVRSEPEPIGIPVAKFRRESPVSPISPTSNCDSYGR
ncbi:hypothetical protein F4677DRAFT_403558 [Hypoxylon crocopeplum]|nr:hypothetical protein F4677DRAFT_403558 [Hypoxylon crocopeplum]